MYLLCRFTGTSGDFTYDYNPCFPMNVDGYTNCADSTAAVSSYLHILVFLYCLHGYYISFVNLIFNLCKYACMHSYSMVNNNYEVMIINVGVQSSKLMLS